MKLPIIEKGKKTADKELPSQFNESYRPGLIRRAVLAQQSFERQPYGADPQAGQRHSSELSKRRRKYRGSYGFGISRVNRKIHSRRGTRMFWVGTTSPQTRGGRRAHAPKAEKKWEQKINKKEYAKAMRSAMAATINKELVAKRGHKLPGQYPFLITSSLESTTKTKAIKSALVELGFGDELARSEQKKVRAGRGTMRNRKYKRKKGILLVVDKESALFKSANNIPGVDIVSVNQLTAHMLAPGAEAGRVTLWSEKAIDTLTQKKLFE